MIRDTAATDRLLAPPSRTRRRLLIGVTMAAAALAMIVAVARWASAERSVDGARVRIAEVTRGTLVRDATVNGRIVAAVSPTLYAAASGTVTLRIRAGDSVAKDQLLLRGLERELHLARSQGGGAARAGIGHGRHARRSECVWMSYWVELADATGRTSGLQASRPKSR